MGGEMTENGPRYDHAARASAEIVNLLNLSEPKAVQFSRVLFLILHAMYEAESELNGRLYVPSEN
jgi:hypothetical protein